MVGSTLQYRWFIDLPLVDRAIGFFFQDWFESGGWGCSPPPPCRYTLRDRKAYMYSGAPCTPKGIISIVEILLVPRRCTTTCMQCRPIKRDWVVVGTISCM